VLCI
jgi:FtsH-binding integral membrane protein